MDNKKWNLKKKKHVKPKCDCKKKKKEEKLKTWASSNWKSRKTKNTFFPYYQKNHDSITTPKKKSIPFFRTKKSLIHQPDFFYCCFFCLVLCLPLWLFWAIFGKKTWLCYYSTIITTYYYYYYMLMCNLCSMHIKSRFEYKKKPPLNPPKSNYYVKCQNTTPNFCTVHKTTVHTPQNKNEKKSKTKHPSTIYLS